MDVDVPQFKILVIDDQYGRPGDDRSDFLVRVQRDESEFVFATGQTEDGRNVPQIALDLVEGMWERPGPIRLSLILLDVRFPDSQDPRASRFGFVLLQALRERFGRALPIVMLTRETDVKAAANEAIADGFMPKEDLSPEAFERQLVRNGVIPDGTGMLLGTAPIFLLTLRELRRVVDSGVMELMLLGETGTGKSEFARYVHAVSPRHAGPFEAWYARRMGAELHYDQLFGHWMGAFYGANKHAAGAAERAHRGTLFIDEIAELSPESQTELLEYRTRDRRDRLRRLRRLGIYPGPGARNLNLIGTYSPTEDRILIDTFLITATNQPVRDPAWREKVGFRQDLYNRLGHRIEAPALRNRTEDIGLLFLHFVELAAHRRVNLTGTALQKLESHDWKEGNIAELRVVAEGVTTRLGQEFDEIHAHHLDGLIPGPQPKGASVGYSGKGPDTLLPQGGKAEGIGGASSPRLVEIEIQSLWGLAESLRTAVIETRRPTGFGSLADILKHATGVQYAPTDVKREVKEILAGWFVPNERQAARWTANPHYRELVERVHADVVLVTLFRYSAGKINWNEAKVQMASQLDQR